MENLDLSEKIKIYIYHNNCGLSKKLLESLETNLNHKSNIRHHHKSSPGETTAVQEEFLKETEILVAIIRPGAENDDITLRQYYDYVAHYQGGNADFLPVVLVSDNMADAPKALFGIGTLKITISTNNDSEEVVDPRELIDLLDHKISERQKKISVRAIRVTNEHIKNVTEELNIQSKRAGKVATFWIVFGLSFLSATLVVLWWGIRDLAENNLSNTQLAVAGIKSLFLLVILLFTGRFALNLAKDYRKERLLLTEQLHNLQFGKTFLEMFKNNIEDKTITKEEVRSILSYKTPSREEQVQASPTASNQSIVMLILTEILERLGGIGRN